MWEVNWSPKLEPQVWFRSPRFGFGALGWQDKSPSAPTSPQTLVSSLLLEFYHLVSPNTDDSEWFEQSWLIWDVIWSPKLEPQVWFRSPRFDFGALGWQDKSSSTPTSPQTLVSSLLIEFYYLVSPNTDDSEWFEQSWLMWEVIWSPRLEP